MAAANRSASTEDLVLRAVAADDVAIFFEHQRDPEANDQVAFTSGNPSDRAAFAERWARILRDEAVVARTIVVDAEVAGHVLGFEQFGKPSVGYWLGRQFWGRGVMTRALTRFIAELAVRPLYARVAKHNRASLRVLEKCGFAVYGEDRGYAEARRAVVEELLLELPAAP